MELCKEVLEGLEVAGDTVRVPPSSFPNLLTSVWSSLLLDEGQTAHHAQDDKSLSLLDQAVAKLTFSSLLTFFLEVAKHDRDPTALRHILEDCKFSSDRVEQVVSSYEKHKSQVRAVLARIGSNPPHIVDVSWRLDYYIKNNHVSRISQPVYLINLTTESDQSVKSGVQLACSRDQLQDLVGKLREACKSLERTAQM
jgi:polycomb group RING finger protein 4